MGPAVPAEDLVLLAVLLVELIQVMVAEVILLG
jgi:hypothetical protein